MRGCRLVLAWCCWAVAGTAMGTARVGRADNWPQWRGPTMDSVSRETGLPLVWNESRNLIWKVEIPEWGTSTPAVWGDDIFLTSQRDDKLLLLKLNRKDGQIVWTRQVGTAPTPREGPSRSVQKFHELHNNASPSPVADGERVIVHFGNGDLAAYDLEGEQLWHHNLQQEYGQYSIWWGHANSPLVFENLVIAVCMQDSLEDVSDKPAASYLVAFDKRNGKFRWHTPRPTKAKAEECDSYTTPVLAKTSARWEMILMGGNQLDAYDPATGKQLWFLPDIRGGRTITGPTVAHKHNLVFVTQGMRGKLLALHVGGEGELERRDVLWSESEGTPDSCCPVVWDDLLFTITDNGVARCYDLFKGRLQWKERLAGDYKASPLAADGRVYFLNQQGLCTVVAASDRYQRLTRNQLDDETIASPAVSDRQIFIRARGHLYCLGNQ